MALLNAVVDLSHHNAIASLSDARDAGLIGIIHKATQGVHFSDAKYEEHRAAAKAAGLLWGAYHFASRGDVDGQVQHFISVAAARDDELLVLDFEPNSTEGTMTLAEAEQFVTAVQKETGRFPGLYTGQSFIQEVLGKKTTTVLSNCWLWIAAYRSILPTVPAPWGDFTMWQYTDGNAGPQPHQLPGIGRCDRDKFNGDETALRALWKGGA